MRKTDLIAAIVTLYDVVEVNSVGAVPIQVAIETIKLINTALTSEQAAGIAADCDSRGKQLLSKDDFVNALSTALVTTELSDAFQLVRDLTARMRVAFRRRYLMYETPANVPPAALTENARTVATFRELFDLEAHGAETISRTQLRRLVVALLHGFPVDANNACKAAIGDKDTDQIGFFEFLVVLQPATSRRRLSDMLAMGVRHLEHDGTGMAVGSAKKKASDTDSSMSGSAKSSAPGHVPMSVATERLKQELNGYKALDAHADRKFHEALGVRPVATALPTVPPPLPPAMAVVDERKERELSTLKLENEALHHEISQLRLEVMGSSNGPRPRKDTLDDDPRESLLQQAETKASELEKELRLVKAQLAISQEAGQLSALLRQGSNLHSVIRDYYPDEAVFVGKQQYLREVSDLLVFEPGSPIAMVLTQYDLIVTGYQSLFRDMRLKYEHAKARRIDPIEAAKQVVPTSSSTPRQQASMAGTPSDGRVHRRDSPVQVRASPLRWKDLDRDPSPAMKRTGMLSDPLLTDSQRHELRARLAAQMRNSARHFVPQSRKISSSPTPHDPRSGSPSDGAAVAAVSSSHSTVNRLLQLASAAQRHRHLE